MIADSALAAHRSRTAPLPYVLAFTALNSFAAGTMSTGIFFVTRSAYQFTATQNYVLGLLFGVGYSIGALGAPSMLARVRAALPTLSSRELLALISAVLGMLCIAPVAYARPAAIWIVFGAYAIVCGTLWPIVQTFLSGGRAGVQLQRAVGVFNLTWSSTLVISYWGMAPLIKDRPLLVLLGCGIVHLASLAFLPRLGGEPGQTLHTLHEHPPSVSASFLTAHRVLLAAAYLVMYALIPYAPVLLDELGVDRQWQTPLVSTWLLTRVITFCLLIHHSAWRGRTWPAIAGTLGMGCGFALAVLAPFVPVKSLVIPAFALGMVGFGAGVALLYFAALFYALEIGRAKVTEGGRHEAMIGTGYTLGPLCGLAASEAAAFGFISEPARNPMMLMLVFALTLIAIVIAARVAKRSSITARY